MIRIKGVVVYVDIIQRSLKRGKVEVRVDADGEVRVSVKQGVGVVGGFGQLDTIEEIMDDAAVPGGCKVMPFLCGNGTDVASFEIPGVVARVIKKHTKLVMEHAKPVGKDAVAFLGEDGCIAVGVFRIDPGREG